MRESRPDDYVAVGTVAGITRQPCFLRMRGIATCPTLSLDVALSGALLPGALRTSQSQVFSRKTNGMIEQKKRAERMSLFDDGHRL